MRSCVAAVPATTPRSTAPARENHLNGALALSTPTLLGLRCVRRRSRLSLPASRFARQQEREPERAPSSALTLNRAVTLSPAPPRSPSAAAARPAAGAPRRWRDCRPGRCGGGSGRILTEEPSHFERPSDERVKEALETGADTIATACPFCLIQLTSAIKSLDVEKQIAAKDIAELIAEAL